MTEPSVESTEERFRQILDAAPDAMIVVDAEERISFVNCQTERLFGYARAELIGQPLDLLIPDRFRPTHGIHVAKFKRSPNTRPMGSGIELFGRRRDGSDVPVEVSLSPVATAEGKFVSAAIRDITERRRLEATTRLAAERLASAVESIKEAFALFDAGDRLVLCNSEYRAMFGDLLEGALVGCSYTELLEAWLDELDLPDAAARDAFRAERLSRRQRDTTVFDVRGRDGRTLRVTDRRTPEGGIVKTIWDLTDDVHREEELRDARLAAEAGSAAKTEFLSSMSHELRTPLNAILGFAQLLQRDKREPLSPRHRERTNQIIKGGEHLLRLIDDILDLSRIEAGRISISTEPVDVVTAITEVCTALEPMAARSRVELRATKHPRELPSARVDRTRLVQILMNFGSNAVKYNRPGGAIGFVVSLPTPEMIRVVVVDEGIGIPADKQDKLFQPFQRAGQETGPIEGTGIGLVITKRLAEMMGGGVGFRSTPGQGSEFWVDVPVHASRGVSDAAIRIAPPAPILHEGPRRRLLYVEDNPANVAFMRDLVEELEALDLVVAPTAEMGLELARQCQPDVIVLDINLPGMSGLDALRALRSEAAYDAIPIIALTAAASEAERRRGIAAGFHRYLTKPLKVDEFVTVLEEIFDSK